MEDQEQEVQENLENQDTPEQEQEDTSTDTEDSILLNDMEFVIVGTTVKKGKSKGRLQYYLKPTPDVPTFFERLRKAVGEGNWDKCVMTDIVRKACNDATLEALSKTTDGKVSESILAQALIDWFTPSSRRSGVHIKDLREKAQEIFSELNPLLLKHFQFKPGEEGALTEEENNRMLQLTLEYSELNKKIEDASRKGKGKGKSKKS